MATLVPVTAGFAQGQPGVDISTTSPSWVALAATGAQTFTWNCSGRELLLVNNGSTASVTVLPVIARMVQGQTVTGQSYALAASGMQAFGPFSPTDFAVGGNNGLITVTLTPTIIGVKVMLISETFAT